MLDVTIARSLGENHDILGCATKALLLEAATYIILLEPMRISLFQKMGCKLNRMRAPRRQVDSFRAGGEAKASPPKPCYRHVAGGKKATLSGGLAVLDLSSPRAVAKNITACSPTLEYPGLLHDVNRLRLPIPSGEIVL